MLAGMGNVSIQKSCNVTKGNPEDTQKMKKLKEGWGDVGWYFSEAAQQSRFQRVSQTFLHEPILGWKDVLVHLQPWKVSCGIFLKTNKQ